MAAQAQKEEIMDIPEGGIANFVMSDKEAEDAYGPDTEVDDTDGTEEFGDDGIAQFPALTKKMAAMGREGDDNLAHVQTGELIIPAKLIENDSELKELLFEKLRGMGIEDPERYVVGSEANSINPETGAYEFFLKKIFGGIKKIFKGIVKVIKKIAPIVLPIVGTMFLGPIYGAALGSGIATLLNGGSIKDAFKSGLTSAVMGGFSAGVSGAMGAAKTGGNLFSGFGQGVSNAASFGNISAGVSSMGKALGGDFSGATFKNMAQGPTAEGGSAFTGSVEAVGEGLKTLTPEAAQKLAIDQAKAGVYEAPGFGESIMKGDFKTAFMPGSAAPNATEIMASGITDPAMAAKMAADAAPGMLRSYLPAVGAATGALALSGGFDVPEQEDPGLIDKDEDGNAITGSDLIASDPGKYLVKDLGQVALNEETGEYETKSMYEPSEMAAYDPTSYQLPEYSSSSNPLGSGIGSVSTATGPFARPYVVQNVAQGGQIFPRRNGGIMPDEGTPGKDSVRAMLMPGEFVMTTDAVKGMGGGDMKQGINNMYSVMRNLESRGRQTA